MRSPFPNTVRKAKPAAKVAKKTIKKQVKKPVVVKAKRVKLGDLPETFVRGFHNIKDVRKMRYAPLGVTGMNVSQLSFGAAALGGVFRTDFTEQDAVNVLTTALKKGINYIDTAAWYGHGLSEKRLGIALKNIPRKAYYIATKACRY
jgi:hypothetical protein